MSADQKPEVTAGRFEIGYSEKKQFEERSSQEVSQPVLFNNWIETPTFQQNKINLVSKEENEIRAVVTFLISEEKDPEATINIYDGDKLLASATVFDRLNIPEEENDVFPFIRKDFIAAILEDKPNTFTSLARSMAESLNHLYG